MRPEEILVTHPKKPPMNVSEISTCITATMEAADACTFCADACLGEKMVQDLVRCIRLNLDCADICETTSRMLSRQTEPDGGILRAQLQACIAACRVCAAECDRHARMHEHCRVCATACRRCEEACNSLLGTYPAQTVISH